MPLSLSLSLLHVATRPFEAKKSSAVCTPIPFAAPEPNQRLCPPTHPHRVVVTTSFFLPAGFPFLRVGRHTGWIKLAAARRPGWSRPPPPPSVTDDVHQVKEEEETGAMILVPAAAAAPRVAIVVEFDKSLLDCPLCSLPLNPPVFQDGERLFLLVANERGVKVVRVTAALDEEGSWYKCKVWMHAPVDMDTGHMDILMLDAKVESCAVPSEEAAFGACGSYLPVPADVLWTEAGGVVLRLRIDKQVKASRSPRSRG